jgi:hypothetical protein
LTYIDRTLTCVDCASEFIHSAADQEFYVQKGFASDPKRCTACRASRRAGRDSGSDTDLRDIGGPRGYERGERPVREYFAVDVRQPGAGPVQAAHGSPGLLLRLLPDTFRGLSPAGPEGVPAGHCRATEPGIRGGRRRRRGDGRAAGLARP